jgi:tetratricopeptide (TPR) repeat protein
MILRFLLATTILFSSLALAQLEDKTLGQMQADLAKIERSIEVTRSKMKEVKDVSFLPDLYFVLGELYADKARYLYTINLEQNPGVPTTELDFGDTQKAKRQAIEVYQRFIENFPKGPGLDKAYFFMAHEQRELGNIEEMVKIYQRITRDFPKSPFWEESQLILGNYFLDTKKDPKLAADFFQKILERPSNPFMPNARYKLGWCLINQDKFYEALLAFEQVVTIDGKINLDSLPDIYKKSDVKRDALLAMVWPYSEQKKLDSYRANALNYFEGLVSDRETLLKVLQRLTRRLMLKVKIEETIPVYFRLFEITNNLEDRIALVDNFYEAYKKSKKKDWPIEDLPKEIAETLILVRSSAAIPAAEKKKINTNWEIYIRDFATQIQQRAVQSNLEQAYYAAIHSYEDYLAVYPSTKYSSAVLLNQAEAFFRLKKYARAGHKYEELIRRSAGRLRKDVFDSGVEAYAKALKNQDKLSKLELAESRDGFRELGLRFVKTFPNDRANPMILFNIGRTYYDERDFDKAVDQFTQFISRFPNHTEATTAGQLILDSFNQREDYDNLIKAGKELIANKRLNSPAFKSDVAEIIRQAEFRKVQDMGGDPRSRKYAENLLKFASKYKGSAVGDQALYEAFVSLKNKKDPGAYDPGEQLLQQHGDSKYAKEVVGQMGQMALNTADYKRASRYFEQYARKYPQDPSSQELLKSSANFRELMGDYAEAASNFSDIGDSESAVRQLVQAQSWTQVAQTLSAKPQAGIRGNYWLGLALYRLGQRDASRPQFQNVLKFKASTFEEKYMAAHSLYLNAGVELKNYQSLQLGSGDETATTKAKSMKLTQLNSLFSQVISYGNGRWTIAALYELGRANAEFADFLSQASTPAGLTAPQQAQFKQLIGQQVAQFKIKAKGFFGTCLQSAEKFEVFTSFVKGCKSQGEIQVDEALDERANAKASDLNPSGAAAIRKKLFDSPRNTDLLMQLASSYLRAQDPAMARLILSRVLEIKPNLASAEAGIGVALLHMNDLDGAAELFKKALKTKSKEPTALYGLAGLYKQYGFAGKLKVIKGRFAGVKPPQDFGHPFMSGL